MPAPALRIIAGPTALQRLRAEGFDKEAFSVMAGASGSAKWLVLGGLDRALATHFVAGRQEKLFLVGSSIGAWRSCCHAQADPLAAFERFEQAYFEQRYSPRPSAAEVSRVTRGILDRVLGTQGAAEVLSNPVARLNIVAVQARHLAASEIPWMQKTALGLAALANMVSRRTLPLFFERTLFHDPRDRAPFMDPALLPATTVPLSRENLAPALLATGAVPLVLEGVESIPGAPPGLYRDGGITDYHFDCPLSGEDGLVLYPHFYPHLVPGWFDKMLKWRRAGPRVLDRTVILCPSQAFVASLPGGKIPDRKDFWAFEPEERLRRWRVAVAESRRLGDEFAELAESGGLAARAEALPPG
ncbi:MAG TPA: patatin-like phospholipase family protein [Gammaproteobacteria bacterium]|nr:patatin-like phospholipase family protein [Gammaproteobacteria bacterium]